MSLKDRLTAFSEEIGFYVKEKSGIISATNIPCLIVDGTVSTCTVEKSYNLADNRPNNQIGNAVHAVRITIDSESDGRVYYANGQPIESYIDGDGKTWSYISIQKSGAEDSESVRNLLHRYIKHIIGAVYAAGYTEIQYLGNQGPFIIPNTFESRAAIGPVQDRIRNQCVAVIGLGGTGSYILDVLAKTPVKQIHLLDADNLHWHNFFRAPGAPNTEMIELCRNEKQSKVDYLHHKYSTFRTDIYPHTINVDSSSRFRDLLSSYPIDYAFVCIDQLSDCESPRQDVVYSTLTENRIPFIDSGISITLIDDVVSGAITTSFHKAGSQDWKTTIPSARIRGAVPGYRNVQLPEINMLAASLAIMEWRRRTKQYASKSSSIVHKFRIESPNIITTN